MSSKVQVLVGAAGEKGGMVLLGLRWISICWPRELCCQLSLSPLVQRDKDHSLMGPISTGEFLLSWDCMSCGYSQKYSGIAHNPGLLLFPLCTVSLQGWKKIVSNGFRTSARGASQTFFCYLFVCFIPGVCTFKKQNFYFYVENILFREQPLIIIVYSWN